MKVYILQTENQTLGVQKLMESLNLEELRDKKVAIKANFNSADPFPASTHPGTLAAILTILENLNSHTVLAERSGMGDTDRVLHSLGIYELVSRHHGEVITLDSLGKNDFSRFYGDHWKRGFLIASPFLDADYVISTCCLKTHRFGGHFTLSLKNSVGAIARHDPEDNYDYMAELHQSPHQRKMIAEINAAFPCHFVILDAVKGFSTLGPERGNLIEPRVLVGGTDRVAVDAVGVAILRHFTTTSEVEKGAIFEQEQIKRAAELGIGVKSPEDIEMVPLNSESRALSENLKMEI